MSDISFEVVGARAEPYAAVPTMVFRLAVQESSGRTIETVALRCQIRIEPQRRRYDPAEEARLLELFGETPRWGDTLKPFLWTHVSAMLTGFSGSTEMDLPVTCTYDFEVAAAKYLHCLEDGEVPLLFLFSGTVFARGEDGLVVTQIPWTREAHFRLPVRSWRELVDLYFPAGGFLRLSRDTLDALLRYKAENALATWEQVFERLLRDGDAPRQVTTREEASR